MASIGILLTLIFHTFLLILSSKNKVFTQDISSKMISWSFHSLLFNHFKIVEIFIWLCYKPNFTQSWRLNKLWQAIFVMCKALRKTKEYQGKKKKNHQSLVVRKQKEQITDYKWQHCKLEANFFKMHHLQHSSFYVLI